MPVVHARSEEDAVSRLRIGIMADPRSGLGELEAQARDLEARGFDTLWVPQVFGVDAITAAALAGHATERIEIGTAVVPTQPRHPLALAQQALTAGAACRGRFTLGVGLSHPPVIEQIYGLSYARRAKHMREVVQIIAPLLAGAGGEVRFEGEELRARGSLEVPGAHPVPLLLAALGDRMLRIAGRHADGTVLWMTGLRAIEEHIVPKLQAAARDAGRPRPRVVAGLMVSLTSMPEIARAKVARRLAVYGQMPSYAAMLRAEGADPLAGLALVGDERALDAGLERLRAIGVTDLEASIFKSEEGSKKRTLDYLQSRLGRG